MAGLDPAIHVLKHPRRKKTWMPATSAGMTCGETVASVLHSGHEFSCNRENKAARGCLEGGRPPRAAARMVRPASPRPAVAAAGGRAGRSVPGLAVGNHAAADRREDR